MIPFEEFYWRLKRLFPGDKEFTVGRYGELSYGYVLTAVKNGVKMHQRDLYEHELPIAQQSAIMANQNRDSKKKTEPYKTEEFCMFKPRDMIDLPSSRYGSAAIALIEAGRYPSWALFCFKELSSIADRDYKPGVLAFVADDAILLHPMKTSEGYTGMLIALESASSKRRVFRDDNGNSFALTVPHVHTKVIAQEGVTLS